MIRKKKLFYNKLSTVLSLKISADKNNTTYRTGGLYADIKTGEPDIMYQSVVFVKDVGMIWTNGEPFTYSLSAEQIDAISALFADGTTGATLADLVNRVVNLENKSEFYKLYDTDDFEALTANDMEEGYFYCEMEEDEDEPTTSGATYNPTTGVLTIPNATYDSITGRLTVLTSTYNPTTGELKS